MPGNSQATLYIGNLDERVDERLLYEIMMQAGPLVEVYMPRDKETKKHKGYAFAEFITEESAQYALSLFGGLLSLYSRLLRLMISGGDRSALPPQASSEADKLIHRKHSLERPQHVAEEVGPVTPSRMQEAVGCYQQGYLPMDSPVDPGLSPSAPLSYPWVSGASGYFGDGRNFVDYGGQYSRK